jgi:beta-glucosidase
MTAQRNAVVLLDNSSSALPLAAETRIFVDGLEPSVAARYTTVVDTPEQADVVLLFLNTVFNGNQPAGTDSTFDQMMATRFPDTNLAFSDEILAKAASYSDVSQLVTLVDLNRPAVLTELKGMSGALVGTFGVSDEAMLDILFGKHNPVGKLPFELPSSMAEVEAQLEDVPDDTANPLFPYGWGLSYQ